MEGRPKEFMLGIKLVSVKCQLFSLSLPSLRRANHFSFETATFPPYILLISELRSFLFLLVSLRRYSGQSSPTLLLAAVIMTKDKRATQVSFQGLQVKGQQPTIVSPVSAPNKLHRSGSGNDQEHLKGKRPSDGHESKKALKGQPKKLQLPNIVRTGGSTAQPLIIRNESPWNTMKEVVACDLAGPVYLVVLRTSPSQVLAVREYSQSSAKKVLRVLQQPKHPNITSATDVFKSNGVVYTIGIDFHLTLDHLVACDDYPCELQLASILAQVN